MASIESVMLKLWAQLEAKLTSNECDYRKKKWKKIVSGWNEQGWFPDPKARYPTDNELQLLEEKVKLAHEEEKQKLQKIEKMRNKHLVALELLSALKQQNDTKPRKGKQTNVQAVLTTLDPKPATTAHPARSGEAKPDKQKLKPTASLYPGLSALSAGPPAYDTACAGKGMPTPNLIAPVFNVRGGVLDLDDDVGETTHQMHKLTEDLAEQVWEKLRNRVRVVQSREVRGSEAGNVESDSEEEPRKGRKKGVATGRPMPQATSTARKPSKRVGQTGEKRARHVAEGSFEEVTIKGQGMRVRGVPDDSTDNEDTIFYEQPPSYPRRSRPEQGGWGNRERGARSRHRTSDDDSCKDDRTCTHEKDMTEDSEGYYPPGTSLCRPHF